MDAERTRRNSNPYRGSTFRESLEAIQGGWPSDAALGEIAGRPIAPTVGRAVREILAGPHAELFRRDNDGPERTWQTFFGRPVYGRTMRDRARCMQDIYERIYAPDRRPTLDEIMIMTDNETQTAFRYGGGRMTSEGSSFSVMARKIDLGRSASRGRWQFQGPVKDHFDPATQNTRHGSPVMGNYYIGWSIPRDREIIHFRAQTVRTGYPARVAESAIILDRLGPKFELTLNIPASTEYPRNEIMAFQGHGWTMGPDLLEEFDLMSVLEGNDETYFWADKEEYEIEDSGLFNYEQLQAAVGEPPLVFQQETADGEKTAVLLPNNRRRRRISTRQ